MSKAAQPLPTAIKLLLVDDHPLVRDGLKARLDATGHLHVVGEAGSGEEALELAEQLRPDLVMVDVSMKGMNGIEFTLRLRERLPEMKVMVLSMYDKAEYVVSAVRAGASGYVLKDTPVVGIIAAIETIAAGGNHFDPTVMEALTHPVKAPRLSPGGNGKSSCCWPRACPTNASPKSWTSVCAPWKPIASACAASWVLPPRRASSNTPWTRAGCRPRPSKRKPLRG